jgi:hypothetical protein
MLVRLQEEKQTGSKSQTAQLLEQTEPTLQISPPVVETIEDSAAEIDMRLIAKFSNGELLRLNVTGFDYFDPATILALDGRAGEQPGNNASDITEPYGFEIIKATTASKEYRWLNFAVLLAHVSFVAGATGIESVVYKVFHVTK